MLWKNPLVASEQAYLQQVIPHRSWQYLLLVAATLVASLPLWQMTDSARWDSELIVVMATPILSIYWLFQIRIMRSAVHLAKHNAQTDTLTCRGVIFAKVQAVLRHHKLVILMLMLSLLGLSLATMIFLFFRSSVFELSRDGRGILKYVGTVSSGYFWFSNEYLSIHLIAFAVVAGTLLLIFTLTNALLSISFGLWAGRFRSAFGLRLGLLFLMGVIFLSMYSLRETPEWTCHRTRMVPSQCSEMLFQMRTVDTIQAISLSFFDGGAAIVTGIFMPAGGFLPLDIEGYQWRHFLASGVFFLVQLGLSCIILWRISTANRSGGVFTLKTAV